MWTNCVLKQGEESRRRSWERAPKNGRATLSQLLSEDEGAGDTGSGFGLFESHMALPFSINTFGGVLGRQALGRGTLLHAGRLGTPCPHHGDVMAQ